MSRQCDDCGIPRWQDCICTGEGAARADHEEQLRELDELVDNKQQRIAIWHDTGQLADELLHSDDLLAHRDDHERLARLTAATGDVATDITANHSMGLQATLLRVSAEAQLWLEALAREDGTLT